MSTNRIQILDHEHIVQKMRRMAYQIYEFNSDEQTLVFVAIEKQGVLLAERLKPIVEDIANVDVHLYSLKMDKKKPLAVPQFQGDLDALSGKSVILIDDVLNSGRTLIYAAKFILAYPLKKLTTVVLVDRLHREFPIKADFVGLTLSTTLQEHINVQFKDGNNAVYLE